MRLRTSPGIWVGLAIVLYGTGSCLFTGWTLDRTKDEPYYEADGREILDKGTVPRPSELSERINPPFSKWWGALGDRLLPQIPAGAEVPPEQMVRPPVLRYRIPHALLFGAVGAVVVVLAGAASGGSAAAAVGLMYALCPNLKAMASLHVTDADAALLSLLAFAILWSGRRVLAAGLALYLLGLAATAKLSALILWPVFGALLVRRLVWPPGLGAVLLLAASLGLGLLTGFLFDPAALAALPLHLAELRGYLAHGQPAVRLLGRSLEPGYLGYYPISYALKTPLPMLGLLGVAAIGGAFQMARGEARERRGMAEAVLGFWLPAVAYFCLFIVANRIQIGLRHILPAIVLLNVGAGVMLGRLRDWLWVVALLGAALLWVDFSTLTGGAYLAYANRLAPAPATRAFADSNLDWGQGIPRHLRARYPELVAYSGPAVFAALSDTSGRVRFPMMAGASSLAGIWSPIAPALKILQPEAVLAGNEIHRLGRNELFATAQLLTDPEYRPDAPLEFFQARGRDPVECPAGWRLETRSEEPALDPATRQVAIELKRGRETLLLTEPWGAVRFKLVAGDAEVREAFGVTSLKGGGGVALELSQLPERIRLRLVWQECERGS